MRNRVLVLFTVLSVFALVGCDDGGGNDKPSTHGRVTTVSGQLSAPQGKGDATTQVKAQMVLGANKQVIAAKVNAKAREFVFTNIPAGDKTILIDIGTGPLPVKFPKAPGVDAWAAFLPDLPVMASLLDDAAQYALALGTIELSADGTYFVVQEAFSPFKFFDTDGNGTVDWLDDDIDGDGIPNDQDETPFGDDWSDWGWGDEVLGFFDLDGDGVPDWEDDDFTGDWFDMSDVAGWDFCELEDDACWGAVCGANDPFCINDALWCDEFPEDAFCTFCSVDSDCSSGWTCDQGFCVPVGSSCDADIDCEADENCVAGACVPVGSACADDSDCAVGEVCFGGACIIESTVCSSDFDCGAGQVCVSGACIIDSTVCSSDIDCGAGEVCVSGACTIESTVCSSDIDCEADEVCMSGACVASSSSCSSNDECPVGQVCMSGVCIPDF